MPSWRSRMKTLTGWREQTSEPLCSWCVQLVCLHRGTTEHSLLKKMRPKCSRSGKTFAW